MNFALILAGGRSIRLGGNIPKQYLEAGKKPIIVYCLEKFEIEQSISQIIIVAAKEWHNAIQEWVNKYNISKFKAFAAAGSSRQHSIVNGMNKAIELGGKTDDNIIIHDAARPNISLKLIRDCCNGLKVYDGIMPVLPIKDATYLSKDGKHISSLLNRNYLFRGQAPEGFILGKYYALHIGMSEHDLETIYGSSEIAYKKGLNIGLIPGDEHNYKITTMADLEKFRLEIER